VSKPRDLHDLWHLTSHKGIERRLLAGAIGQKLDFRGKPFKDIAAAVGNKEARLKALWASRLNYQMITLPELVDVFRAVLRTLHHADLP
jgi:hypothetical protein